LADSENHDLLAVGFMEYLQGSVPRPCRGHTTRPRS
jgi:hypothetical protein